MSEAPDWTRLPDLACRAVGGSVAWANDELFAERENLIRKPEPEYRTYTFGHKGQVYDGWETRRRRELGEDHAIVRLGLPGVIQGVVVDTAFFKGNYPPFASVEATAAKGYPAPDELTDWRPWSRSHRSAATGSTTSRCPRTAATRTSG